MATNGEIKFLGGEGVQQLVAEVKNLVSDTVNDAGYLTSYTETDPTVPSWAKASSKPSYTASEVGLGNVDNVKQYSTSNPPPYPVTKVNNKTGAVTLSASDVGADASGTASSLVSAHNTNTDAHSDIRERVDELAAQSCRIDFVDSMDECTNTNNVYVLPDGEVVGYIENEHLLYTNQLPIAIDTDGTIYNGKGYKENIYEDVSGTIHDYSGWHMTGFIPATKNSIIRLKNIKFMEMDESLTAGGKSKAMIYAYLSDFSKKTNSDVYTPSNLPSSAWEAKYDETGNLIQFKVPSSYSSSVAYIRIGAREINEDSIVTVNEEIASTVEHYWQNSGYKFFSNEDENKLSELESKVNSLEDNQSASNNTGNNVSIPSYWQAHLDEKVLDIRTAMQNAGWNKSAFLWYNDAHWSYNYQKSPLLLKYLYQNTGINKTNFGGDIVLSESENLTDMSYLWEWRNLIRDLPNHHSVVGNHDDGNEVDARWAENAIYSVLLAPEETSDIVYGSKFYYYIDCPSEKTRYLYLDTATKNNNVLYDDDQKAFIKQALIDTPEGWHIVAISHIWLSVDYDVNPPVVTGFSMGGQIYLDMFDSYNLREGDFAECNGWVEFCMGGHSHIDADYASATGIPVIVTECDSKNVRSGLSCTSGTISENSVNAIVADYNNKTVNVIRIGRGESRVVPIVHVKPISYTNWAKNAYAGSDKTIYNDGKGYKENVRVNSSGIDTAATGWDATGLIPCKTGDIIRFKNVEVLDIANDGGSTKRSSMAFYDSSFTKTNNSPAWSLSSLPASSYSPVYGENGDIVQLTAPSGYGSYAYIRLTCGDINEDSIITVNEEIG